MRDPTDGAASIDEFLTSRNGAKILVGFLVAGIMVYLLGLVAGWKEIERVLSSADLRWLALACVSTGIGLAAWSQAWRVVLETIDVSVSPLRLIVTYLAATFANYITPFGQAGGEPFIAYVLSQDTDTSYEKSLASVVVADILNLLPFFNFAAIGFAVLLWRAELPAEIRPLSYGLTFLAVALPVIAYFGWHHRLKVERGLLAILGPVITRTDRFSRAGITGRIDRFYTSIELVAEEPRGVARALVYSYSGWAFFALPLYLAAKTVGVPLDPLLVFFIVPASTLAGFVPTPGGLGGVEAALVALLLYVAPEVTLPLAFAIATVYRIASYWFAICIGGIASLYVIARA